MMGLGYLGSSNLSPLAPPFTVDRSNHNKPDFISNPDSHFNHPSWPYPHSATAATQEFLADSPTTTSDDYGYIIPDPNWSAKHVTPPPSQLSAPKPKPFSYNLTQPKPFYPPYATPVHNDDIPLVTFSEPSYELLSTSGLVQDDYTRSLAGLEYNPHQEGVWPQGQEKQGRKRESDDTLFSEEANINIAASIAYNNYVNNQGAYGGETLSKGNDDLSLFYYAADIINSGPSSNRKSDGTPFSANNQSRLDPNKGGSTFRAFPMFSESHPLIQSSEPPEEPWNSQKLYTPFENRFHMFDCSDDRIKKSSSLVIKPPATVLTQGTSSSKSVEIGNIAALNISDDVGSHKPLKEKELRLPQGSESGGSFLAPYQLSFQLGRSDQDTFVASSSTNKDMSTKLSSDDQLNFEFKARPSFQVPDINIPNINTTENVKSGANSFDHHNPAEDSPCWKGAPTSHFLPFGAPEAESPQPPTKKLQTGNGVDLQTDYSFNNSSTSESDEKTLGSIPVEKEHSGEDVGVGLKSAKASSGGRAQSVHDTIRSKKGHCSSNSQTCKLKLPNLEEDVEHVLVSSVEDAAANLPTAKKVNASILVKALNNLSDLLLLHCSNDEFALKDHDREAIDHVIANLDVCMSRVASTHKLRLPQQNTSNTSQEGAHAGKSQVMNDLAHYQKEKSDILGKNVEKLLDGGSIMDEADALKVKDDTMVQAIKKVLDENLECKVQVPPETLLYKNLWLEAEAELCSLTYRARFERMKRETEKGKPTDASKIPPKADSSKVSNSSHLDDVEASVMARFNILKCRGEPNPVSVEEQDKACGKGSQGCVQVQHHLGKDDGVVVGSGKDDVDPWVMARLNILKCRGESSGVDVEVKDYGKESERPHIQDEVSGSGSDWEHIHIHTVKEEFSWQSNGGVRWWVGASLPPGNKTRSLQALSYMQTLRGTVSPSLPLDLKLCGKGQCMLSALENTCINVGNPVIDVTQAPINEPSEGSEDVLFCRRVSVSGVS